MPSAYYRSSKKRESEKVKETCIRCLSDVVVPNSLQELETDVVRARWEYKVLWVSLDQFSLLL